jgi:enoyl-CoA hydratase
MIDARLPFPPNGAPTGPGRIPGHLAPAADPASEVRVTDVAAPIPEPEIVCRREGAAGTILLNRPRALNALNREMIDGMRAALDAWENEPGVRHVVIRGAGERAFCAGGDIRLMTQLVREGRGAEALDFWHAEYQLNCRLHRYRKPVLALIDGIVMGGGVGVSLHGSHRIGTEHLMFAMPEVGIGFFPDVGATHALPRLPGQTGTFLALTGERIGLADAVALGIVTHPVSRADIGTLFAGLVAGEDIEGLLARLRHEPGPSPLMAERDLIDDCFAGQDVRDILARLDERAAVSPFAARIVQGMRTRSPTSMAIALRQMREGARLSFEEAMGLEFRIVSRVAVGHDFHEGVRAVIIDKDQSPRWRPPTMQDLVSSDIEAYFAPLPVEFAPPLPVAAPAGSHLPAGGSAS